MLKNFSSFATVLNKSEQKLVKGGDTENPSVNCYYTQAMCSYNYPNISDYADCMYVYGCGPRKPRIIIAS
jgi:hypothetical protein